MEKTTYEKETEREWKSKLRNAQDLLDMFKRQAYKDHTL